MLYPTALFALSLMPCQRRHLINVQMSEEYRQRFRIRQRFALPHIMMGFLFSQKYIYEIYYHGYASYSLLGLKWAVIYLQFINLFFFLYSDSLGVEDVLDETWVTIFGYE